MKHGKNAGVYRSSTPASTSSRRRTSTTTWRRGRRWRAVRRPGQQPLERIEGRTVGGSSTSDTTFTSAASDSRPLTPTLFMRGTAGSLDAGGCVFHDDRRGRRHPEPGGAVRNTSGSGFPTVTSSATTTASKHVRQAKRRSITSALARGADVTIACRQPAAFRRRHPVAGARQRREPVRRDRRR